jgi:hypothetical protein
MELILEFRWTNVLPTLRDIPSVTIVVTVSYSASTV